MNIIRTKNLTKEYKGKKAVDNVNMTINKGEIYGLVGENGSGKSTIIKMILGLVNPTAGEIEIFGESDPKKLVEGRASIGAIVESPAYYEYLTVYENLEYFTIARGIEDKSVIDEVIDIVRLTEARDKKFKELSLGMKQRLGIAHSIMINPEVLILDEPINGLDPQGIMELRKLLLKLNHEKGMTILISSHILEELSYVANKYGFIKRGSLIKEISLEELEKECRKYLLIEVDRVEDATVILEEKMGTLEYKVNNKGEILLYDYLENSKEVVRVFTENGISIESIAKKGINLEDYYMDLMEGF